MRAGPRMVSRSSILPAVLATGGLGICAVYAWSEFRVATTRVPSTDALVKVEGVLETCVYDSDGLLEPVEKLHGGWSGGPSYVLTVRGLEGRFRTSVFQCGVSTATSAGSEPSPHLVSFAVAPAVPGATAGDAAPLNAYGLAVDGVTFLSAETDLDRHRRAHDFVSPLNAAGLGLLAFVVPVWTYRAARRRNRVDVARTGQGH